MSSLTVEDDLKWVPTHVQVTVLRGRGLRGKGKHGTSDVYTIIQLGKEKYSTGVAEKTTEPEWREECCFELPPGALLPPQPQLQPPATVPGGGGGQAGGHELVLTVMHRALIGLDVFLGQAVLQLDKVFKEGRYVKNEWYRLNSKTGKKEKERGELQVSVQFTRNNLTASMYDLVMKDKGGSTFTKLKERMRAKRRASDEDSAAAAAAAEPPGGSASLYRMRNRLPSDGGGEEDYEDDEGGEVRRSKMRTFFLRGKLRKSSDTRSSTSLGSESSESSSRGGSLSPTAGISVVVSDLSNSPSNSSNLTADNSPEHTANTSPLSSSLKCDFGEESGDITIAVPQRYVNGSHVPAVPPPDPGSGSPAPPSGPGLLPKSLALSASLQNLNPRPSADPHKAPGADGRRWSFDKPGDEEKAAIAAALEQSGPMMPGEDGADGSGQRASESGRKQEVNAAAAAAEKHRGWFGSKDAHNKVSLVVSPNLESSTDPHPPPLPSRSPPPGPPVAPTSVAPALHHTNPFSHAASPPPPTTPLSPCNPFFSSVQQNPFYDPGPDPPSLPPLPFLSGSRPPITLLFPQADNRVHAPHSRPQEDHLTSAAAANRPLPPAPPEAEAWPDPFASVGNPKADQEWDECFEAFAAGRLHSPEDPGPDCETQQNPGGGDDRLLENRDSKGALQPVQEQDKNQTLHHQSLSHQDANFAQFLATIPEQVNLENDTTTLTPLNLDACTDTNKANRTANDLTDTNAHPPPRGPSSTRLNNNTSSSGSPDPASSGLGSSVDDEFLSCLSSYSDKLSSSEEAEARSFESSASETLKPSESRDRPGDLTAFEVVGDERGDSAAPQPPGNPPQEPVITARETETEGAENKGNFPDLLPKLAELPPESSVCPQPQDGSGRKEVLRPLGFPQELGEASRSNDPDVDILVTPDDKSSSKVPSLYILTSSPDLKQRLVDTSLGRQDSQGSSPVSFGAFGETGPGQDFENTLLRTGASDQSSSSFLQSLYVSTDSQDYLTCASYQTCSSHQTSGVSGLDQTPNSVESTLCGDVQTTADESNAASVSEDHRSLDDAKKETPESKFDNLDLEGFSAPLIDFDDAWSPQIQNQDAQKVQTATRHRSRSEGNLAPGLDEILLPSFGSDPGATPESSSAQPDPALPPPPTFSDPFLTPSSSPVPFHPFPLFADDFAWPLPDAAPAEELQQQQQQQQQQQVDVHQTSPHLVRPLTAASPAEEKRPEGRSVLATGLEKLKSTIHPGRGGGGSSSSSSSSIVQGSGEQEADKKKILTEGAGSYYHLTHNELVALLVRREAELRAQRAQCERERALLAKCEAELRRLKPQVRDLEDYIDTLLVRIMEQKPTLLQVKQVK